MKGLREKVIEVEKNRVVKLQGKRDFFNVTECSKCFKKCYIIMTGSLEKAPCKWEGHSKLQSICNLTISQNALSHITHPEDTHEVTLEIHWRKYSMGWLEVL